jgi:hypothetical protein
MSMNALLESKTHDPTMEHTVRQDMHKVSTILRGNLLYLPLGNEISQSGIAQISVTYFPRCRHLTVLPWMALTLDFKDLQSPRSIRIHLLPSIHSFRSNHLPHLLSSNTISSRTSSNMSLALPFGHKMVQMNTISDSQTLYRQASSPMARIRRLPSAMGKLLLEIQSVLGLAKLVGG